MNDETSKKLTEYIGECWHKYKFIETSIDYWICRCGQRAIPFPKDKGPVDGYRNRSFNCPDDAHIVFKAMVDKGDWGKFYEFARDEWARSNETISYPVDGESDLDYADTFIRWLFLDPARFCTLAGEWLMKEKQNDSSN